jgi:hypothetical protein
MDAVYSPSQAELLQGNGYAHHSHRHDESDDDDDSNPLGDLEALGEKEEQESQIREDEAGLQSVTELTRPGWDDGFPPTQPDQGGAGVVDAAADVNGTKEDSVIVGGRDYSPRLLESSLVARVSVPANGEIPPVQSVENGHDALVAANEPPETNGNFRAVNGMKTESSAVAAGGMIDWRTT